jgi:ribose 5-phosphate isomerase A
MTTEEIKRKIGAKAAEFVKDGMTIGLGTGSTAFYFIEKLIERCQQGLKIQVVASSQRSLEQAQKGGIPLLDINKIHSLDLTVDGADEIDTAKRMIKGGGGALMREKIVASMSREMLVIVDESKLSHKLGSKKLPVEIVPFGIESIVQKLHHFGYQGTWRKASDGTLYITDNGNLIYDIFFPKPCEEPELDHEKICSIAGVLDTGFFFHLAGRVIIGFFDGQIVIQ